MTTARTSTFFAFTYSPKPNQTYPVYPAQRAGYADFACSPLLLKYHPHTKLQCISKSIDVKEDTTPPLSQDDPTPLEVAQEQEQEELASFDKRRAEEKFAVLNTGISECKSCGYLYDQAVGDPSYPVPPGFSFEKLPEDWRCPTCGAAKSFFENKSVEIAGFAENQQFGLGGNTLTSGQKALLIYGSPCAASFFHFTANFLFYTTRNCSIYSP
ncbi:Rubredoxin-like domain-containing protein [Heracleum sosnowskyi]|uniref:Rubredoxin-like domain-containing protein n=1 Tax=Heracleum sosnowskyi TaxID=360622 RepID=A0AAD8MXG8_9APIA|nr:Rubredoxin-like domain-containing protein [Heracleum sosnowskyi]